MQRVSIRTLMAFIFLSAMSLAVLKNANEMLAGAMFLFALDMVGIAILVRNLLARATASVVDWLRSFRRYTSRVRASSVAVIRAWHDSRVRQSPQGDVLNLSPASIRF